MAKEIPGMKLFCRLVLTGAGLFLIPCPNGATPPSDQKAEIDRRFDGNIAHEKKKPAPNRATDDGVTPESKTPKIKNTYFIGWGTPPQILPGSRTIGSAYRFLGASSDGLFAPDGQEGLKGFWGVLARGARALAYDIPIGNFSKVWIHETLGHGGYAREKGFPARYDFKWNWRNWNWSGTTTYNTDGLSAKEDPINMVSAGVMATQAAALDTKRQILLSDNVHWSYWPFWFFNKANYSLYIWRMPSPNSAEFDPAAADGNDMAQYVSLQEQINGRLPRQTSEQLLWSAAWNAIDPMAVAAVSGYVLSHIGAGQSHSPNPMLNIGGQQFFAGTRATLTGDGPILHLDLYWRDPKNQMLAEVSGGMGFGGQWQLGTGFYQIKIAKPLAVDVHGNLWNNSPSSDDGGFGGQLGGGASVNVAEDIFLHAGGGVKTKGELMGRAYGPGPYFDGGLVISH